MAEKINKKTIWDGKPCVVVASGPSLAWDDYADVDLLKTSGVNTVAVNNTWERVKFCKAIYAGDGVWWKYNHNSIDIPAERWTCARSAVNMYGCIYRARFIKPGYNSGANAVELAVNVFKANPVIMIGFDCSIKHGIHHHGNHKNTSNPTADRAARWMPQFKNLVEKTQGTEVINCSRYSEIGYFPKRNLKETLCALGLI